MEPEAPRPSTEIGETAEPPVTPSEPSSPAPGGDIAAPSPAAATSPTPAPEERAPRKALPTSYRALDAERIVRTLRRLRNRVSDRFPDSGLTHVCDELVSLGNEAKSRAQEIGRPLIWLRICSAVLAAAIVAASASMIAAVRPPDASIDFAELISVIEAGINDIVLIGAAIFFLVTLETRIKRGRALRALHELRSVAHIIDMHQLTKDPERLLGRGSPTVSSPRQVMTAFELSRYLDYCSELLSLTGKIAALYVQRFDDPVALASVNELENLCTGLSRKIWQKIMILQPSGAERE